MHNVKRKKAAALRYEPERDRAPRVIAKGAGVIAERIIERAGEEGIPITEDPDLVEALIRLDFHEHIPPQLYRAVSEILAFAYRLNGRITDGG